MGAAYLRGNLTLPVQPHRFGCTGKQSFVNRTIAYKIAKETRRGRAYPCAFCNGWHITTMDKPRRKADAPLSS